MECLTALVCMLPCMLVPLLVFAIWMGLADGKRNKQRVAQQTSTIESIGLQAVDGSVWRVGTIEGRPVSVKAMGSAKVRHYEGGGVTLGVTLVALIPLAVPVKETLFRNNPRGSATTFERHYYTLSGEPPDGLPDSLTAELLAWALDVPSDRIEVGLRDSKHLYAGQQLPNSVSIVRVERAGQADSVELKEWLEACVARVERMEA